jgi:hypothetical protein
MCGATQASPFFFRNDFEGIFVRMGRMGRISMIIKISRIGRIFLIK